MRWMRPDGALSTVNRPSESVSVHHEHFPPMQGLQSASCAQMAPFDVHSPVTQVPCIALGQSTSATQSSVVGMLTFTEWMGAFWLVSVTPLMDVAPVGSESSVVAVNRTLVAFGAVASTICELIPCSEP